MKIFITYATAGAGHIKAAQALYRELSKAAGGAREVKLFDSFADSWKFAGPVYNRIYLLLVQRLPFLWGAGYYITDNRFLYKYFFAHVRRFLNWATSRGLVDYLKEEMPDVIVCTHFYMLEIACALKKKNIIRSKIVCVVTDFMPHNIWIGDDVDVYIVAHGDTKKDLQRRGIRSENICVAGIPVDPAFFDTKSRHELAGRLALREDMFTALVVSGGFGVGPVEEIVASFRNIDRPVQLLVVCGKNEKLKGRIERLSMRENILVRVYGFVKNMDELMSVSDVMITKSGGLIVSEALAKEIPLILVSPIPGQEEKNRDFILRNKLGVECCRINDISRCVREIMRDDRILREFRVNLKNLNGLNMAAKRIESILTIYG